MKQLSERYVTLSEVKEILEKQEKQYAKEGKEMLYEQKRAKEHSEKFAKLPARQARELVEKISALSVQLPPEKIIKIADLMPETIDDVRAIFAKERFKYTEEEIKQITDLIAGYK
ncbi:MAG: RNA polymerase Rpb4 family protein [Candidatus Altiarchaeota archaeon]|nr:RNA polymerase Rpb4 family protein [Candidatus Altiarchaeota archaeon]